MASRMTDADVYVCWDGDEEPVFPARLLVRDDGDLVRWNGWLVPLFDRPTAERIVRNQELLVASARPGDYSEFRWYGDVIVERWVDEGDRQWPSEVPDLDAEGFTVLRPYDYGDGPRYSIGGFSWTWYLALHVAGIQ